MNVSILSRTIGIGKRKKCCNSLDNLIVKHYYQSMGKSYSFGKNPPPSENDTNPYAPRRFRGYDGWSGVIRPDTSIPTREQVNPDFFFKKWGMTEDGHIIYKHGHELFTVVSGERRRIE